MSSLIDFIIGTMEVAATTAKIRGFAKVPEGWHYGSGGPPPRLSILRAVIINENALAFGFETQAFLGVDREVQVTVDHDSSHLQFTIATDLTIEFVREEA